MKPAETTKTIQIQTLTMDTNNDGQSCLVFFGPLSHDEAVPIRVFYEKDEEAAGKSPGKETGKEAGESNKLPAQTTKLETVLEETKTNIPIQIHTLTMDTIKDGQSCLVFFGPLSHDETAPNSVFYEKDEEAAGKKPGKKAGERTNK